MLNTKNILCLLLALVGSLSCQSPTDTENQSLTQTLWTLQVFIMDDGPVTPPSPLGQVYTIQFQNDSTCIGRNDCNSFQGSYLVKQNDEISINISASTKLYCGHTSMSWQYLTMLEEVTSFLIHRSYLVLYHDGAPVMRFSAKE